MNKVEKITKLTEQHRKELELAEKHRNRAREHTEIAEKHTKRASDLENQIKYQKGEQVYDRVDALQLTPDELGCVLRLLDDKTQLMNVVQSLFSENTTDNTGRAAESERPDEEQDDNGSGNNEDVVRSLFSENTTDNTGRAAESERPDEEQDDLDGETMETGASEDLDMPYDEIPVFGDADGTDNNEEGDVTG